MNYDRVETRISNWAKEQDLIRAVVVIGSRAREDHKADAWSDLDLMLFVTDQQRYVKDTSWLATFGEVWLRVLNFTGAGDPEWLVLYEGGMKVDFLLAPATGKLVDTLFGSFYAVAARRGVRIRVCYDVANFGELE
jgi:aminoglycoside 6-adenylyltransferase